MTLLQDRQHNIINGADNTLTYEVALPWEEVWLCSFDCGRGTWSQVQQQAVQRRIAEAAKTQTRSANSHEI